MDSHLSVRNVAVCCLAHDYEGDKIDGLTRGKGAVRRNERVED